MKQDTDVGCNNTKKSEFSVERKQQSLKCRCVKERLQRKKVVDKEEETKLRGTLRVYCRCCRCGRFRGGPRWQVSGFKGIGFAFGEIRFF